jgi:hypothetical protein
MNLKNVKHNEDHVLEFVVYITKNLVVHRRKNKIAFAGVADNVYIM